jgi:hypothetical protein
MDATNPSFSSSSSSTFKKRKSEEQETFNSQENDGVGGVRSSKLLKTTEDGFDSSNLKPLNSFSVPLLTDMYEVTMVSSILRFIQVLETSCSLPRLLPPT